MWSQHFSPDTFLEQTAATFAASLRGRAKALAYWAEQDVAHAWHTAAFTAATQSKRGLQPLKTYLKPAKPPRPQTGAEMLEILKGIKAAGAPMDIKRVN